MSIIIGLIVLFVLYLVFKAILWLSIGAALLVAIAVFFFIDLHLIRKKN